MKTLVVVLIKNCQGNDETTCYHLLVLEWANTIGNDDACLFLYQKKWQQQNNHCLSLSLLSIVVAKDENTWQRRNQLSWS